MIPRGIELIRLKSHNVRSKIWRLCLKETQNVFDIEGLALGNKKDSLSGKNIFSLYTERKASANPFE